MYKENVSFSLSESGIDCNLSLETRNLRIVVIIEKEEGKREVVIDIIGDLCVAKLSFSLLGSTKELTM